jgi:hypothetical protein
MRLETVGDNLAAIPRRRRTKAHNAEAFDRVWQLSGVNRSMKAGLPSFP